jgi:kinetochore protein Mis12/MTW1
LKQECARNDAIISQLRSLLSTAETPTSKSEGIETVPTAQGLPNLSFLTSDPAAKQLNVGSNSKPLTTNTTFILSQLPALRSMLAQLRPKLQTLPRSADEMEIEQMKDERREYIEGRTRMHLERTGELGIGDGSAIIAGRKVDSSEAQALETVVEILNEPRF